MTQCRSRSRIEVEAVRLHARYRREVVERYGLCPWAKHARSRVHVVFDSPEADTCVADLVHQVQVAPGDAIDVAFLIAPTFTGGFDALERWTASLQDASDGCLYGAAFHPAAPPGAGPVRFFRQTPDPTMQFIKRARLEEVRSEDPSHYRDIFTVGLRDLQKAPSRPSVADSVFDHNAVVLAREGRARLQAIFDDLQVDRARTYARFDLSASVAFVE